MEELTNIASFCNTVLIRYASYINDCSAIYLEKEDMLECRIKFKYSYDGYAKYFQYHIAPFNFSITDTEILVNRTSINAINHYINQYIENIKVLQD